METEILVKFGGKTYSGQIAEVKSVHIGKEDHGINSINVDFEGDGWGQGTGHYPLLPNAHILDQMVTVFGTLDIAKETVMVLRKKGDSYGQILGFAPLKGEKAVMVREE